MIPVTKRDVLKIAIIGSKAGEGSGIWIPLFGKILLKKFPRVSLHCFDSAEVNEDVEFTTETETLRIHRYASFYEGEGTEFDVVVDDSFITGHGIEKINWKSEWWSQKVQEPTDYPHVFSMFFHQAEGRAFESPRELKESPWSTCQCPICRVASLFSVSMPHFREVRSALHMVEKTSCEEYAQYHDLALFSVMFKKISGGERVTVTSVAEKRVISVMSEITPMVAVEPNVLKAAPSSQKQELKKFKQGKLSRTMAAPLKQTLPHDVVVLDQVYEINKSLPYFSGKVIEFFGESPLILGDTAIARYTGHNVLDCAFVREARSLPLALKAKEIWALEGIIVHGYEKQASKHNGYVKWTRRSQLRLMDDEVRQQGEQVSYRKKSRIKGPSEARLKSLFMRRNVEREKAAPDLPQEVDDQFANAAVQTKHMFVRPYTPQLSNVVEGFSGGIRKKVEDFVKRELKIPMSTIEMSRRLKNICGATYEEGMLHVNFLLSQGLIRQEGSLLQSMLV